MINQEAVNLGPLLCTSPHLWSSLISKKMIPPGDPSGGVYACHGQGP
jgi:hypothetical protein